MSEAPFAAPAPTPGDAEGTPASSTATASPHTSSPAAPETAAAPAAVVAPAPVSRAAGKKRSRGDNLSPVPDAIFQSALAQASQICGNLGLLGLATILTQPVFASQGVLPTTDQVQQAATKAYQEQPPWVHWNKSDMAASFRVTGSHRLALQGSLRSGYRMARASVGCASGSYYYEYWVSEGPTASEILANLPPNARLGPGLQASLEAALAAEDEERRQQQPHSLPSSTASSVEIPQVGGHLRLGWSMRTGDLQAPVGYDKWSYALRDLGGLVHQSIRKDPWVGGGEVYGAGDVMGTAICLDPEDPSVNHIRFFKNGDCLGEFVIVKGKRSGGEAFCDLQSGTYYPALSAYMGGAATANFGPKFVYPPRKLPPGLKLSPVCELCPPPPDYETTMAELAPVLKQFRKAEHATALQEAVQAETKVLMETYDAYMRQHLEDIKKERVDRGLTVADFPAENIEGAGTE
jgi:Set1/Ash2 histone methyltransferase complex subunit ASH2